MVNLAGYGRLAFPESGVYRLAGFSDRLLELLLLLEAKEPRSWMADRLGDLGTTAPDAGEEEA